jgi:hypothetical protein
MPLLTTQSAKGFGFGSFAAGGDTSFESIASVLTSSTTSEVNFSSIPSTYSHLQVRMYTIQTSADNVWMQFNGDTSSSSYYWHELFGQGSAPGVGWSGGTTNHIKTGYTHSTATNMSGQSVVTILDYANTSKKKTANAFTGTNSNDGTSGYVLNRSGHWTSTSAISSLRIFTASGSFRANTRISLYGIKG